jgi:hypothetical protein
MSVLLPPGLVDLDRSLLPRTAWIVTEIAVSGGACTQAFRPSTVCLVAACFVVVAGMPDGDPPVDLMPLDAVGGNLGDTHKYANIASYEQNMK